MALSIGQNIDRTRDRDAAGSFYMGYDEGEQPKKRRKKKPQPKAETKLKKYRKVFGVDSESVMKLAQGLDVVDPVAARPIVVPSPIRQAAMLVVRNWFEERPFEPMENVAAVVEFPKDWGHGRYSRVEASSVVRARAAQR